MVIFHGKLLVITRGYIYILYIMQYTFLCFGLNMDLSWHQDSRIHRLHRLPFNGSAWRTAWSACRSAPVYPSRWSALGPSHHGPCFWHMVFMQIGDSTSPNIYKNGDLPNKNSDFNVFFIKKQRNVHISNFWCQIWVPFQYPPTWDILGTPLTGNLIATYNPC